MEDRSPHSVRGAPEMAQPAAEPNPLVPPSEQQSSAPISTQKSQPLTSSLPISKKVFNSQTTSATNSPKPSRESSPIRPPQKSNPTSRTGERSRKNSFQDASPTRSASAIPLTPSTAPPQKSLSAANIPQLHPPISEPSIKAPIPQKLAVTTEVRDVPRWPISPRLRSPPPVIKSLAALRTSEQDLPAINVQKSTPTTEGTQAGTEGEELLAIPGMRTPARGVSGAGSTLETVQEISQPGTPAVRHDASRDQAQDGLKQMLEHGNVIGQALTKSLRSKPSTGANESGSESGGNKGEIKMRAASLAPTSTVPPNTVAPTKSYSTGNAAARGKPSGEGSTKHMTVETETVSSIPQVAVGGGAGGPSNNGSLRAKPSSETIRPKKEKKKPARKAPSVTSGTASSKADIFEAKIASAVDEANSSDSDETFVYESNPPETNERRRFHSRTPSATSMASQVDQRGNPRSIHGVIDGVHGVAMKKSMKFANSYNNNGPELGTGEDDGKGTARSNMGTGRGTTHHHHIGRWGRNGGNGHPSLFDNESPFPNAAKSKLGGNTSRNSSRPSSPKTSYTKMLNGKKTSQVSSGYDIDDGARADDERTPLIASTIRSTRSGRSRRQPSSSIRQLEHQASRQPPSLLNRFAGCLVLTIMMLLVVSGAIGFMFATTQPLSDVKLLAIKNVLATHADIMLDMQVQARNPNVVVISVESMDVNVFAKSKHLGGDSEWWKRPQLSSHGVKRRRGTSEIHASDDSPNDPYEDPDDTETMLLGRIFSFDSPLLFDGSPFKNTRSVASGAVRLENPGNSTEPGDSERWEKVLKYEFDLILKGVLKYQLPMSQKVRSVGVDGRVTVNPNENEEEDEKVHII